MGNPARRSSLRRVSVRRRLLVERLGDRRVLAAITGEVFEDVNLSFHRDIGEANAPSRLVFIDANRNAKLDNGEATSVADSDGTFLFDNLVDGSYSLRLYNGAQSQIQTTPFEASAGDRAMAVSDARQFATLGPATLALTGQSIVIGNLAQGTSQTIPLGNELTKMQSLPDGKLLVVGSNAGDATSWIVNPVTGSAWGMSLEGQGAMTPWSDVALDASGRGLLLEQSDEPFALRAVDASVVGQNIHVTTTSVMVPADTTVLNSETGNRSVLAWAGADGLQLSLWSNTTASMITSSATAISDAAELLAFDDASGLIALRTLAGDVSVLDVDGGFTSLHTLDGVSGPVAIDAARELLATISSDDGLLKMFSLRDGEEIAEVAVDLSSVGAVSSLALNNDRSLTLLGAAGLTEIALRKPSAHEVTIVNGENPDPILFGVSIAGGNAAPAYSSVRVLSTDEDTTLTEAAPSVLVGSFDADGDEYVLIQRSDASHGIAHIQIDGSISYTPHSDFNGTDSVVVLLHDGRDVSAEISLNITVNAVADGPTGITVLVETVPENLGPGAPIGTIEVIDADGLQNHRIDLGDPRFGVNGGQIIFVGGPLDFEGEPEIAVAVIVTDPETGQQIQDIVALSVGDENDPITAITPDTAKVRENAKGGFVAFIGVDDEDGNQTHSLTVDDDRFVITNDVELTLRPGVFLDYETETSVVVNVTAKEDIPNGNSLTESIKIEVGDVPEQPQSIQLSNDTVMEMVPGDLVGDVTIDGGVPNDRFELAVDDPRFEIIDGTLKLLDDQIVEYASQSEIELEITAVDSLGTFSSIRESFLIQVMENDAPYHNHDNPYDVDHSGSVTALDALAIINYLNTYGPGPVGPSDTGYCYDVNADAMVTALDALLVLNEINRIKLVGGTVGSGESDGEGEQTPTRTDSIAGAPDAVKNDNSLLATARGDDVFGQWGGDDDEPETSEPAASEEFAESVDQTLRLLSDETS